MLTFVSITIILFPNLVLCDDTKELKETCVFIDYAEKDVQYSEIACLDNDICNKTFKISYVNMPPHNLPEDDNIGDIEDILKKCCGDCVGYTINTFQNLSEVTPSAISNSHFVYPFLATSTTTRLHGFYYLPYFNAPDIIYITKTDDGVLFRSIFTVYPVIIVCVFLAIVSGFIAWILETWSNKDEFPRSFLVGWFEGFWWSFISMTTVGYGDKTPKSIPARLFSVVWILIGIIAFGLLTGELTGRIIKANSPPPAEMKGKDVGALRFRDYDAYVVSQNGGNVILNHDAMDFESDVLELINKLHKEKIHGFVLDKWTLAHATEVLNESLISNSTNEDDGADEIPRDQLDFFFKRTTRVEKSYKGKELSYGMLIKRRDDYEYFKDFVEGNQLIGSILDSKDWIEMKKGDQDGSLGRFYSAESALLFGASKPYFQKTMIAVAIMIGVIFLFGVFYELKRRSYICKTGGDSTATL